MADDENAGFKEFPKWKYKGAEKTIVTNEDEEESLGDGWGDVPGFDSEGPLPPKEPTSEPKDPAPPPPPPPDPDSSDPNKN